jgi:enoyl-CoA hydratase/carnithine racemase
VKYLQIKKDGSIATVSINRQSSMNALSIEVLKEFCTLQEYFRKDLETRVVIFTGEGDHFSAGADLKEKPQLSTKLESWRNNFGKPAIKSILDIDQITIAAVNGYCLGGAACIVSACDFRIASEKAILGYPEINLGINLNWLGLPLAVRLIGPARAKKMVIGGENENAETLLSWGFYDEVCKPEILIQRANEMAKHYASKPPIAAQMIKRSVNNLVYKNDESIMHMDYDQTLLTHETKDRREAVTAFFEKRDPEFKGD